MDKTIDDYIERKCKTCTNKTRYDGGECGACWLARCGTKVPPPVNIIPAEKIDDLVCSSCKKEYTAEETSKLEYIGVCQCGSELEEKKK